LFNFSVLFLFRLTKLDVLTNQGTEIVVPLDVPSEISIHTLTLAVFVHVKGKEKKGFYFLL